MIVSESDDTHNGARTVPGHCVACHCMASCRNAMESEPGLEEGVGVSGRDTEVTFLREGAAHGKRTQRRENDVHL